MNVLIPTDGSEEIYSASRLAAAIIRPQSISRFIDSTFRTELLRFRRILASPAQPVAIVAAPVVLAELEPLLVDSSFEVFESHETAHAYLRGWLRGAKRM